MAIEGTGIKAPSKKASRMAGKKVASSMSGGSYGGYVDAGDARGFVSPEQADRMLKNPEAYKMRPSETRYLRESMGLPRAQADTDTFERRDFFSMKTDPRNEAKVATAGDFSGTFNESDFQGYMKALDIKRPKALPPTMIRMLKQNYQDDVRDGRYKEGQLINQATVKEKPSFVEQTKNLAGSIFNTVTGTQPAAASQIPGGMPTGTQFTSSNLDAARASTGSVDTGDTSFSSFRMAGGEQQQQGSGIVTPFSQTSMGKGEARKVTPFSETSMGKGEPVKVTPFRQTSMGNKTVTVDGQKVAARQTVASLPSDYKQTEAREFAKAAAFQQAKKNPNVTVGVDSKGQPVAKAVQKSRTEAGASAKTAEGNKARVQQNAKAKAQAAAFNRKMSGKSISQTKAANKASMKASAAARNASFQARKKAGTLSRSERTASGQRAAKKAAARKRAQSAAKARRARKKKSKKGKK